MVKRGAFILFAIIFLSAFVSAEIIFSQTENLYNIGDDFEITISLIPSTDTSSFLTADLSCEDSFLEIYKSPYKVLTGEQKDVTISATFDKFLVENLMGDCKIIASYNNEEEYTHEFEITSEVDVNINIQGTLFDPGQQVYISGTAIKENSQPLEGFVEITLDKINFSFVGPVNNGDFNLTFQEVSESFSALTLPVVFRRRASEIKTSDFDS